MSAKHTGSEVTKIERSQFMDIYPACSSLISEIGREFINTWTTEETDSFHTVMVNRLVGKGIQRTKAETAWRLLVQESSRSASAISSAVLAAATPLLPALGSRSGSAQTEVSHDNVFSFEGGRWVVSFQGMTIYPQNITGIKYLHCLISKPGKAFSPKELYEGFGGRVVGKQPKSMSSGDAIRAGLQIAKAQPDVLIDQQGRNEMLVRLEDIESEMIAAKMIPNADLIEKLAMERIQIKEQLRKAFTPVGSRRIQEPELVRRMKAVDIAIRRAKEKIQRAGHSKLLHHLNQAIEVKVKTGCRYLPAIRTTWRTNEVTFNAPKKPR